MIQDVLSFISYWWRWKVVWCALSIWRIENITYHEITQRLTGYVYVLNILISWWMNFLSILKTECFRLVYWHLVTGPSEVTSHEFVLKMSILQQKKRSDNVIYISVVENTGTLKFFRRHLECQRMNSWTVHRHSVLLATSHFGFLSTTMVSPVVEKIKYRLIIWKTLHWGVQRNTDWYSAKF